MSDCSASNGDLDPSFFSGVFSVVSKDVVVEDGVTQRVVGRQQRRVELHLSLVVSVAADLAWGKFNTKL